VRSLPTDTQRLLLVAAAEPVGDVTLLSRAIEQLGIGPDAAEPAVAEGLVEFGARVRFRHPLVRSAVYRSAALSDCRDVHRALAEAIDPASDPDRRAWHRAQSAVGPDEAVADDLERSAERAQRRGGAAAAAAFLERATALTPDPGRRGGRALAAAQAKFEAAVPHAAHELLAMAQLCPLSDLQRARLARLCARMVFAEKRGSEAVPLLADAARRYASLDAEAARETLMEALDAAIIAGRLSGPVGMREVANASREAPPPPDPPRPVDLLLDGVAEPLTDGYTTGLPKLRHALASFRQDQPRTRDEIMRWLRLAPIAQEAAVHQLWDYGAWDELARRSVQLAREAGALGALPVALVYLAGVRVHAGDLAGASTLIHEADAITAATRYAPVSYAALALVAWRGDEVMALELMSADVRDATARGEGTVLALAGYATALLYNGLSRYDAALSGARRGCDDVSFSFFAWTLAELIEAAAHTGSRDVAEAALDQLAERTTAAGTDWSLAMLARSRALLSDGAAAERLYREAIERLERSGLAGHLARARLIFGEWLRREDRRVEAREQLRLAHDMLTGFGAHGFAERTRRELVATGETVQKRTMAHHDFLTAQEAQVARLAADGHTNAEIGSQLFISHRTAEYHLHKVYAKLGIRSRRKLRGALRDLATAGSPD
jgi:DNA-binding CsgD family transcriptional regulator